MRKHPDIERIRQIQKTSVEMLTIMHRGLTKIQATDPKDGVRMHITAADALRDTALMAAGLELGDSIKLLEEKVNA